MGGTTLGISATELLLQADMPCDVNSKVSHVLCMRCLPPCIIIENISCALAGPLAYTSQRQ